MRPDEVCDGPPVVVRQDLLQPVYLPLVDGVHEVGVVVRVEAGHVLQDPMLLVQTGEINRGPNNVRPGYFLIVVLHILPFLYVKINLLII